MVKLADIPEYERRHLMSKLLPPLGELPWVVNDKPLSEKKVAIITTAGLNFREDHNFEFVDSSYRALPRDLAASDILMTHASVNYDRSGFQEDINVVFPVDRFKELESQGVIGRLADVNYSFMGGGMLPDVYEANARGLAKLLKADGVDAAFIVPVCPNCSRTVCGIAYYFESEGIQTAGIALFREIAETMKPPRILWVSFPLGRPLGKPSDAAFQTEVIKHAMGLLDAEQGPVLEDYPIDLPDIDTPPPACPVSFQRKRDDESWHGRLWQEVGALTPWYELGLKRRGRTTVGVCESSITDIVADVTTWADDVTQPFPEPSWLKLALEDLKSFYSEAITAQPGDYEAGYSDALIFDDTVLGELIIHYVSYFEAQDPNHPFVRVIASREQLKRSTGNWAVDREGAYVKSANPIEDNED
ncbi:MAG: glycine/sarcosine/betaine reductase selenoprotein B family protein [Pseudomonadota bacterium]|nr:glycine/sarcosine/betaine reductase selenoprotein B family protein [Pseudomonadota bacterium]